MNGYIFPVSNKLDGRIGVVLVGVVAVRFWPCVFGLKGVQMPYKIPAAQAVFCWQLADDLPAGMIEQVGCSYWLMCCPLCGMLHILAATVQPGDVLAPGCILPTAHPDTYAAWLERYPEAARHQTVKLVYNEGT